MVNPEGALEGHNFPSYLKRELRGVMKRSLGIERRIKAVGGWVELKESRVNSTGVVPKFH